MLDGRYPSERFAELRPRIVWDRTAGTIRGRKGARQLAVTNAGTIPDRGLYGVHLPDGRRVGELDEEMVYEARPGQTFLLGATTWRIEEITRDRVIVTPAPGRPRRGPVLARRRDRPPGRARQGDRRLLPRGGRRASPRSSPPSTTSTSCAAENLVAYLREQQAATRVVPSDETIVVERFRDEIGDWRLCVLSPVRRPRPRRLGPGARRRRSATSATSRPTRSGPTTASSSTSPTPTSRRPPTSSCSSPTSSRTWSSRELSGSALFGARFRENAARSLLIPRAYPGKRTPLWQQRLKSQSLLEVARDFPRFPVILETYRECLRDVLDLPALDELLRDLHSRQITPGRGRDARPPRRSPPRCSSTTSPPTCTRATRRTPSAAPPPSRSTATCCASCSARRSCAS